MAHTYTVIAFFVYFALLLVIGLIAHRKQKTSAEFIMGNRSLNYWLTALSAHASDMSAWLFMALPSAIFVGGLCQSWIAVGLILGMFLNWQFVAKKLRDQTEKTGSYTLSTFFEKRFKDDSGLIRILTATMSLIFLTSYLAAGMIAMGLLFESVFEINYFIGLSAAMFVAVTYTLVGGYVTVAWTDSFQAIFLLIVIVAVPIITFLGLPEAGKAITMAAETKGISACFSLSATPATALATLFLVLQWGLGYFGLPHVLTKFMGIKDSRNMKKSQYVGMTWQIIALTASVLVGFVGLGYFGGNLDNSELVFVEMVKGIFHPFTAGFILCAIIGANMSTMDSQILVCASVMSEDFYKRLVRQEASEKELLLVSRIGVIAISLISLIIAFSRNASVLDTVSYAWMGLGCSFGPVVLMSLYSKVANKYGAIAGILLGGTTAAIWPLFGIDSVPAMIPGFFLGLLSIYTVSRATAHLHKI